MVRVCVREIASQQGLNMSQLQRKASLPMSTVQRYWHGTGAQGQPLTSIDLRHVDTLCAVLSCEPGDLLRRTLEQKAAAPALPPMAAALLAVLPAERTPVQQVYEGMGWTRAQLAETINQHRAALETHGMRLYVATKEQASGRQERYIELADGGISKRYSALSREVTP